VVYSQQLDVLLKEPEREKFDMQHLEPILALRRWLAA
ncbi:uncharacterized protein METZ01_LOCUS394647, partial [marine metagenome]